MSTCELDIDITGIDKYALIAAMYNHARPQGMGCLSQVSREARQAQATAESAQALITRYRLDIDDLDLEWVDGRYTAIMIKGNTLQRADLYDRDNGGKGTLLTIVESVREKSISAEPASLAPPPAPQ